MSRKWIAIALVELAGVMAMVCCGGAGLVWFVAIRTQSAIREMDEVSRVHLAQVHVRMLTTAVELFNLDHEVYPASLEQLLERDLQGNGPYLEGPQALADPWGRVYQYDPAGARNNGQRPDIWTEHGDRIIGNWSPARDLP